ncbi:MAG: glycoside hydrolase family 3 C-terminal domain-containing protein [Mariniblastus sp.]|nr:glycoside hydrolase family 3 C-terminal domain-containing protein [Mariniblastus sp.]
MKNIITLVLVSLTLLVTQSDAQMAGRFAPPAGKVLIFAGQDNASVGGTDKYRDGYVDNIGVPGGITHYVYFSDGWTNDFGRTFAVGTVDGLNSETEWASGPMNQKAYLDSPTLDRCVMHLSISMEGNSEDKVADGSYDHLIRELVQFVADHPDHPFLIRIGYEFDGSWNKYDPENFKLAFRRIVDALRSAKLTNFATVYASSSGATTEDFKQYDPGASYYDWVGYSWWGGEKDGQAALDFARKRGKPIFIAEATPRGHFFDKEDHDEIWDSWFETFFKHIEDNLDVVRAVSYINADWDAQDMWDGWGQTRIETAPAIKSKWLQRMAEPRYVNAADKPFKLIGFPSDQPHASRNASSPDAGTYKDPTLQTAARVEDLLSRMTLEEKVAQLTGWWDPSEEKLLKQGEIFKPSFYQQKCPHGIGELGPLHNMTIDDDVKQYAAVQTYFRTQTRLGIPAILHDEAAHGFMRFEANSFPTPIGLSCTWNPDLLKQIYSQAAQEARVRGVSHVLSPIVDVAGDLRWGRIDETLGEDPFLTSRLGAAMVEGLQGSVDGSIAEGHVAATLKHFVGYGNTEGGRNRSPYQHGRRKLLDNEVYPFRHIIQHTKPAAVMAAFNEVDGLPCHVNPWVLSEVLRNRIGFEGLIVGDYQGIDLVRKYQRMGKSDADAARMALQSGLELELPNQFGFQHLPKLIGENKVEIAAVDAAVRSVLSLKFRLGLFEAPMQIDGETARRVSSRKRATELARESARQSIVLLKNEAGLLPLEAGKYKSIAVIGPNANVCRLGNYSGRPLKTVSLLEGIKEFAGDAIKVSHAQGCQVAHNDTGDSYANWRYVNEVEFVSLEENLPLIEQAAELAKGSDLVVLALGESVLLSREAWGGNHVGDRATMDLTDSQQALVKAILATGKPVVTFLNHSKPVTLGDLNQRLKTVLAGHYAGQETGTATAEILFGKTNPSGKLTLSWPQSVGHLPAHYSQHGSAQVFDYLDSPRAAVFPFGHGLSYTQFKYEGISLSADTLQPGERVQVRFQLTNTGNRRGTEISQVYVSGEGFEIGRPLLELKGFARTILDPGQTKQITIELDAEDFFFHDFNLKRVFPSGKYQVRVGGSSTQLGESRELKTIPRMTSGTPVVQREGESVVEETPSATTKTDVGPSKPNVLLIAIDDFRPEIGSYGSRVITPNMDRFSRSSIRLDRAYCQQAVCGASRLSLMSGLYPTATQEQTFHVDGWRERHPNLLTMNQHFRQQGFKSVGLGKIYHGTSGKGVDPANWDRWINLPAEHYANPQNIALEKGAQAKGTIGNARDPAKGPLTESADVSDDTYGDGRRAAKAVELLQQFSSSDSDQPFFLAVGLTKPHLPFVAPQKYWDLYDRDSFKMPSNKGIPPGYPIDAANLMAHEMHKYSDFEGERPADFSDELNGRLLHGYAACVSYVDACVGRILDKLEETGLSDNTIVVVVSDHGWKLGDHSSWCKHTNFECDTRVPLMIRDPRIPGGLETPRLVELIDLYPTLCDLTGSPIPAHCQGRSFRALLEDPQVGHRLDAYSSYPAHNKLGHSIRFKTFRYTEWRDEATDQVVKARVLTDLAADPGEETNLVDDEEYADILAYAEERLQLRIDQAKQVTVETASVAPREITLDLDVSADRRRQKIDGFGGSIAFWATHADDTSLKAAIQDLNVSFVRAQGEVTKAGIVDHNRDLLQRAMEIKPDLEVVLTFWQPRSREYPKTEDWLDVVEHNGGGQYYLKPSMEDAWADEMVKRTQQYRDWGINVTCLGVQNETNYSHVGTQTCMWKPDRLRSFIDDRLRPKMAAAGLNVTLVAPDLAYVGPNGSELQHFLPVIKSPAVDIVAYHMYDSYRDEMDGSLDVLRTNSVAIGQTRLQEFPNKKFWMTETTGAQWNNEEWHTYGWEPKLNEYEKALLAARYIHMTFADAGANAFFWWGLVYAVAPQRVTDPNLREKHRDEGLVLVQEKRGADDQQKFLERTKKFYFFKQFSKFVKPGYSRIEMESPTGLSLCAFMSPDQKKVVVVAINTTDSPFKLSFSDRLGQTSMEAFQTDANRNCSAVSGQSPLPPQSARTYVFDR